MIAASPCIGVEMPGAEVVRERFLDDGELIQLWAACEGDHIFGAAIRVMVLVGARRSEVAEMLWSEIDTDARIWTLPAARSKNRRAHVVPLSSLAWEIINAVPRIAGCDFVFSTTGKGPIANFHHIKDRLDAKLNFDKAWRIHESPSQLRQRPTAPRSPRRSYRGRARAFVWQLPRHRRHLPTTRFCRREARRATALGRSYRTACHRQVGEDSRPAALIMAISENKSPGDNAPTGGGAGIIRR